MDEALKRVEVFGDQDSGNILQTDDEFQHIPWIKTQHVVYFHAFLKFLALHLLSYTKCLDSVKFLMT